MNFVLMQSMNYAQTSAPAAPTEKKERKEEGKKPKSSLLHQFFEENIMTVCEDACRRVLQGNNVDDVLEALEALEELIREKNAVAKILRPNYSNEL
jgi:hypothetical protein